MAINPDNVFGTAGHTFGNRSGKEEKPLDSSLNRNAFVNRPTKGKTARKRRFPPTGKPTNIGDPMKGQSISGKKGK